MERSPAAIAPTASGKVEKTLKVQDLPNAALPQQTLAELAALRENVKPSAVPMTGVVHFSASWCGCCRQAKAFLAQRGISYQEKDIDTPEGKLARIHAGGGGGVPMLVANGAVARGFSAETYESLFPRGRWRLWRVAAEPLAQPPARYVGHGKSGLRQRYHRRSPGLQYPPPQAGLTRTLGAHFNALNGGSS